MSGAGPPVAWRCTVGKKLAVLGALAGVPLVAGALAGCSTGSGGVAQPALEQSCVDELPVDDWSWVASEAFRSGETVRVAVVGYDLRGDAVEATVECTDGYVSSSGAVDASSREAPLTAGLVGCAQSRDADGRWVSFEGKLWANTSGELGGDRLCRLEGIDSLGPGPADAFLRWACRCGCPPPGLRSSGRSCKRERVTVLSPSVCWGCRLPARSWLRT